MTDKKGSVWDRPITQEERDLVSETRRDKRYAGENVLLFEGRVVGHCT